MPLACRLPSRVLGLASQILLSAALLALGCWNTTVLPGAMLKPAQLRITLLAFCTTVRVLVPGFHTGALAATLAPGTSVPWPAMKGSALPLLPQMPTPQGCGTPILGSAGLPAWASSANRPAATPPSSRRAMGTPQRVSGTLRPMRATGTDRGRRNSMRISIEE